MQKYQGVKEFHMLARISCYCKIMVFSPLNVLFAVTLEGKNPYIYLSRPYLCQEHTLVLGI